MSYVQMWQTAKNQYTTAVQAKKPSAKFLGFIKKSTGVEPACTALDAALAANNTAAAIKALAELKTKAENYLKVLEHEAEGDNLAKVAGAVAFAQAVKNLLDDATKKVTKSGHPTVFEVVGNGFFAKVNALCAEHDDGLKHFCTAAPISHDYATNANNPALTALQNTAKADIERYVAAKAALAHFRDKTMPREAIHPFCIEAAQKTLDLIHAVHTAIASWGHHQDSASKAVDTVHHQAYLNSLEFQLAKDALDSAEADVDTLTEAIIDLGGHPH